MPSPADHAEPSECLERQLTRTNSDESAITRETARDLYLRFDDAPKVKSTGWTNEKHCRFLDSLEASFVRDLYHSTRFDGQVMKKNSRSPFSSDQFMVVGHECLKNINRETNVSLLDSTADSRVGFESPRLPHFMYSQECLKFRNNGSHSGGKLTSLCGSTRSLDHNDLVCTTEEVSDQNFVDDVLGGNSSRKSKVKRLKTAATGFTRKD